MALLAACGIARGPERDIPSHAAPARVLVDFRPHSQWNDARRAKVLEAAGLFERALNDPRFIDAASARGDLQRTEGLAARDIMRLTHGGLTLADARGGARRDITLAMAISPLQSEFSRDDGFTDLDTLIIYVRRDWLDRQPVCLLAGLLAHEHMHVMGFTHTTYNHPWRRRSVPYAIGDMVAEHAQPGCVLKANRP
jgi:hypothetical protein